MKSLAAVIFLLLVFASPAPAMGTWEERLITPDGGRTWYQLMAPDWAEYVKLPNGKSYYLCYVTKVRVNLPGPTLTYDAGFWE